MGKKAVCEEIRWQVIALKKTNKYNNVEIGKMLNISEKSVRTTLSNYNATGKVAEKKRSGKPPILTPRDESIIFRLVRKSPRITYKEIVGILAKYHGKVVSVNTVRRSLLRKKIAVYKALRKPLLKATDRLKRYRWCKERINWGFEQWKNVIFSDESNFELFNRKGQVLVKRFAHERFSNRFVAPRLQGGGGSVGIWGCFSYEGTGICKIYDGRINADAYINTLENCLVPSAELLVDKDGWWQYQQDGAPAHTARASLERLREVLRETFYNIPTEICQNLVMSMRKRCQACILAKGGYFKY